MLALNCGYQNSSELYSVEISNIITEFEKSESYKDWNPYSKDRFKFDVIIRNCGTGVRY